MSNGKVIMSNGEHDVSVKVKIEISLDALGRLNIQATTTNMITIFGMIEMAKKAYLEQAIKNQSPIEIPRVL